MQEEGSLPRWQEWCLLCPQEGKKVSPHGVHDNLCRPLWDLHRCLLALEYATFACPANEMELVSLRLRAPAEPGSSLPGQGAPAQSGPGGIAQSRR